MAELIGDDWRLPGRDEWESMPEQSQKDQPSGDRWGLTPRLSYEDRIRTVLFEAGTRRMDARMAGQRAMAEIAEALCRRGDGILPIREMSRLSRVTRSEIYKILKRGADEPEP